MFQVNKLSAQTVKPTSRTLSFTEIEDNNQNVRWDFAKGKYE